MAKTHSGGVFTDLEPKLSLNRWITSKYLSENDPGINYKRWNMKQEFKKIQHESEFEKKKDFKKITPG